MIGRRGVAQHLPSRGSAFCEYPSRRLDHPCQTCCRPSTVGRPIDGFMRSDERKVIIQGSGRWTVLLTPLAPAARRPYACGDGSNDVGFAQDLDSPATAGRWGPAMLNLGLRRTESVRKLPSAPCVRGAICTGMHPGLGICVAGFRPELTVVPEGEPSKRSGYLPDGM